MDFKGAVDRSIGVSTLDIPVIEAVEHDRSLTQEAGIVVAVVAVVNSLSMLFAGSLWGFIAQIIVMVGGWWVWGWLCNIIARGVFNSTTTSTDEMLRVTGYAYAPLMLGIFDFILPVFSFIGFVWTLIALVIGIRQAGELSTAQAILTALLAAIPWLAFMIVLNFILF